MRHGTGMALVLAAGVLWSLQGLAFRQIGEAGPWAVLAWRSLGMVPALLLVLAWRARGSPWPAIRAAGPSGLLGGLALVLAFGGAIVAFQSTTIANAVLLFAASPILAALLGWAALGERVAPRTWLAIALALLGIFVMVREGVSGGALLGNAAALASSLGFAAFTVTLRWRRQADTLPTVLVGALLSILAGALLAGPALAVPASDALWSFGMGAVTLSGGMALYTLGSRVVPAAELALLSMTEVLLAPLWAWLFLREGASAGTLLGGAVLLAAVLLDALGAARQAARAKSPQLARR